MMRSRLTFIVVLLIVLVGGGFLVSRYLSSVAQAQDGSGKILVWIAPGEEAGDQPVSSSGSLMLMSLNGATEPVMDIPPNTEHVIPCGDKAEAPDRSQFAFFVGTDKGALYIMTGALPQLQVVKDSVSRMTCAGSGTFTWSPDNTRFAYLDYSDDYNTQTSVTARLMIHDSRNYSTLANYDNVAAFDLTNSGAAFISFFKNDRNEAKEVSVSLWDGSSDQEIAFQSAEENCMYISAGVTTLPDKRLAAMLGYRCTRGEGRTTWQFYTIDPANRSMTMLVSNTSPGRFVPYARTSVVYASPDGTHVFFTVPDGVTAYTASLNKLPLADMGAAPVIENNIVMPQAGSRPYADENHLPLLSPDGRLLAVVRNTANNQATLTVLDMSAPDLPPIEISAGERGNTVREMLFTPDSSKLVFVSGGDNSAVSILDTVSGTDSRLVRDMYGQGVLSPDGTRVVVVNHETISEREPAYVTLVMVNLTDGSETQLFAGAEIVDNKVTNQRFAYPLSWR
jgi:hypothetical protein